MWFRSLFDDLLARSSRAPARHGRPAPRVRQRPRFVRPCLEILEVGRISGADAHLPRPVWLPVLCRPQFVRSGFPLSVGRSRAVPPAAPKQQHSPALLACPFLPEETAHDSSSRRCPGSSVPIPNRHSGEWMRTSNGIVALTAQRHKR